MRTLEFALLRLYPRAWRQRYAGEMRHLLVEQKRSLRTIVDLIAGAVDARLNPQLTHAVPACEQPGARMTTKATWCNPAALSAQDQWRSAGWMVGGSLVLSVAGILLKLRIGPNSLSEALIYAAFPAALMLSSECTYLKRYSTTARRTISIGAAIFVILITWGATALGNRI